MFHARVSLISYLWSTLFVTFILFVAAIAETMKETQSRFRALGNMGDVLIKMEQVEEAIKVYQKQLILSKQTREKTYEATAYGSLGVCHRLAKHFDKALGYHTQVRTLLDM